MADGQFQVYVSGARSTSDDWFAAMGAPDSDLPLLSEDQKFIARKFDVSESEYARGVLTEELGERRQIKRGEELGIGVAEILSAFGSQFLLRSVARAGVREKWIARIAAAGRVSEIEIPLEFAGNSIDLADRAVRERLKEHLADELHLHGVSANS